MKKVNAIIERANDGTYSIYMDAPKMNYLVTGTGSTAEEAINTFMGGYEDMKRLYSKKGKNFEEVEFSFKYLSCGTFPYNWNQPRAVESLCDRTKEPFKNDNSKNSKLYSRLCFRS